MDSLSTQEKTSLLHHDPVPSCDQAIDRKLTPFTCLYDMIIWLLSVIFDCFFREIQSRGDFKIPSTGPTLFVGAPHANQFVDPILLMRQARESGAGRRISFMVAEKSMHRLFVGTLAKILGSIPVSRPQDNLRSAKGKITLADPQGNPLLIRGIGTQFTKCCTVGGIVGLPKSAGNAVITEIISDTELKIKKEFKGRALEMMTEPTSFKVAEKVDQSSVYNKVFEHFRQGGCVGIFPEGGSHDRPGLLPLKAGVAIMALGAMVAFPDCQLNIVPCGMNYFHPDKFRSRAVIEFGNPFQVPPELVEMYKNGDRHEAIKLMLDRVKDALLTVTVAAPDYDTLMVIQASRRLYKPANLKLPLPVVVELNRRLLIGYNFHHDDPRIIHLRKAVLNYNRQLRNFGLRDHQVESGHISTLNALFQLTYRSGKLILLSLGALPGFILFSPIFLAAKLISRKKAQEALAASTVKIAAKDVMATWKLLVGMGLTPALYWFYSILATYICWKHDYLPTIRPIWLITLASMIVLPMISYAALRIGEVGMDIFKSLPPLILYLNPRSAMSLQTLQHEREELSAEVTSVINSLGPETFPDFEATRLDKIALSKLEKHHRRRRDSDGASSIFSGDFGLGLGSRRPSTASMSSMISHNRASSSTDANSIAEPVTDEEDHHDNTVVLESNGDTNGDSQNPEDVSSQVLAALGSRRRQKWEDQDER